MTVEKFEHTLSDLKGNILYLICLHGALGYYEYMNSLLNRCGSDFEAQTIYECADEIVREIGPICNIKTSDARSRLFSLINGVYGCGIKSKYYSSDEFLTTEKVPH